MKESMGVRFLYGTVLGRALLKVLTRPCVSRAAGRVLDSKWSACLIPFFIRKYHISVRDVVLPKEGFASFNAFFCRRENRTEGEGRARGELPDGWRIRTEDTEEREIRQGSVLYRAGGVLVSPCDGLLSCIPIRENVIFDVKHTRFTLEELLRDRRLAEEFTDGLALIFRLTPAHYHRYCFAADGRIVLEREIPGILHCVRPLSTSRVPVYAQNARQYQVLETAGFGKIVQMEIGALMIGRITNPPRESREVRAGEEKGYFEFGGSTIVLLLKDGGGFWQFLEKN